MTLSLVLLKVPKRKIQIFTLVCGTVISIFLLKQYLIFGLVSTSSFAGSSCLHSIGKFPFMEFSGTIYGSPGPLFPDKPPSNLPKVITRVEKMAGAHNYNNITNLMNEKVLLADCIRTIRSQPLILTVTSYLQNTLIFFRPSSSYITSHVIADLLPWRGAYNFFFSGIPFIISIVLSAVWWLLHHEKKDLSYAIGSSLPLFFIFASCVLFEKVENMRYKFFIEPVLYLFIIVQLVHVFQLEKDKRYGVKSE
jgi:hypothetical protein